MKKPLTENELRNMSGLPVYCPQINAYGIVRCDKVGKYANRPFLVGVQTYGDDMCSVNFEMDIIQRKLKCYLTSSHDALMDELGDEIPFKIHAQDNTVYDYKDIDHLNQDGNCLYARMKGSTEKHLLGTYESDITAINVMTKCNKAKGLINTYYMPEK